MGMAPSLAAILEAGFTSGYISPKTQIDVRIARAATSAGPVPPEPPSYALGKYTIAIGDGTNSVFTVTHNLNTLNVVVSVRETATDGELVATEIQIIDANTIQLTFGGVPTSGQYQVTVVG